MTTLREPGQATRNLTPHLLDQPNTMIIFPKSRPGQPAVTHQDVTEVVKPPLKRGRHRRGQPGPMWFYLLAAVMLTAVALAALAALIAAGAALVLVLS